MCGRRDAVKLALRQPARPAGRTPARRRLHTKVRRRRISIMEKVFAALMNAAQAVAEKGFDSSVKYSMEP